VKLYTKFHQNRPSFVEDITQNILVCFCPRDSVDLTAITMPTDADTTLSLTLKCARFSSLKTPAF